MGLKKILSSAALIVIYYLSIAACVNHSSPEKIADFTLADYNGKKHSLSHYKESKAIVIIFIATECPVSNDYNSRMEKFKDYKEKIAF
jgi:peroxiredoxin